MENSNSIILIIAAIIGAPFLGILVTSLFSKNKTGAETHNLNISGEVSIGEYGLKIAKDLRSDLDDLRTRFKELETRFETMRAEKDAEIKSKDTKIAELEKRIDDLEAEVLKYRGMGDHVAEVIHTKVDEIKNELSK